MSWVAYLTQVALDNAQRADGWTHYLISTFYEGVDRCVDVASVEVDGRSDELECVLFFGRER